MGSKCKFSDAWLDKYGSWIERVVGDSSSARCKVCKKKISVFNMGVGAVRSHEKGEKHAKNVKQMSTYLTLNTFVKTSRSECDDQLQNYSKVNENPALPTMSSRTQVVVLSGTDVIKAEILWVLKCVSSHYSYNSCKDISKIFQRAFPDSDIAQKFSCGENKAGYIASFGLGPYVQNILLDKLKSIDHFVIMFDESHNSSVRKKQLDIHVRFWDNDQNKVVSRYLKSEFIGHGRANDMLPILMKCLQDLGISKLVQISMDGPTVNWSLFRLLCDELNQGDGTHTTLLNIGSCGLHTFHNAFKNGCEKSGIIISKVLKGLYWLFKDSPARREDYTKFTGSTVFPLKFCGHRWLENQPVVSRALEIWPHIIKYVKKVRGDKKLEPTSQSYSTVKEAVLDPLTPAAMGFFQAVAADMTSFLTIFQSDRPLVPFLAKNLELIVKRLLQRSIKSSLLENATNAQQLLKIDIERSENHLNYQDIDIGFKASGEIKELLSKGKISEKDVMDFRMKSKKMLICTAKHIMNKTPLSYQLARNLSSLDPRVMKSKPEMAKSHFNFLLSKLIESKRIDEAMGDTLKHEFSEFISYVSSLSGSKKDEFLKYDLLKSLPLDSFLFQELENFKSLQGFVKMLLIMSHGQALVERGFSFNKEIVVENMKEHTLISQRHILDHLNEIGGIDNFLITQKCLQYVSAARQKYRQFLEDQQRESVLGEQKLKRKLITDQLSDTRTKKRQLESDAEQLLLAADEKVEKAEKSKDMKKLLIESNALRKGSKQKQKEASDLNSIISKLEEQLKEEVL